MPNSWFLQQFNDPPNNVYPFYKKQYWDLFAKVLVKRGIDAFKKKDVKILNWLQDINWPGVVEIVIFVRENSGFFSNFIFIATTDAFIKGDDVWLHSILTQFLLPGTTELPIYINLEKFVEENIFNITNKIIHKFNKIVVELYEKYRYPDNYKHYEKV